MLNTLITKTVLFSYNLLQKGKLFSLYRKVKQQIESQKEISLSELSAYMESWGFDKDITKAPILTKADIKKHTLALDPKSVYKYFHTGGSTGEPLKIPHSRQRALLRTASILYYNEAGGYDLGDRYLFIRSKPKSKFFQFLRNEVLFVPNDLSKDRIAKLAKTLIRKKVSVIIGYPSVIYELAVYINQNLSLKKSLSVKAFISNSEPFDEERRSFIKDILDCKMIDRYSNEENGVIAQQSEFGGEYLVDRYNLFVEVVDPVTLTPVAEGKTGKVLVTDIYSDLIPMVRYDSGDFAVAAKYKNGQLWSIKQIVGRVIDRFFTTSGKPFSPLMLGPYIRLPLTNLGIHVQFQFSQLGKNTFRLQVKAKETDIPPASLKDVKEGLKSVLGQEADIEIVFVDDIKALPSGKRPLYRNEMDPREKTVLSGQ